MSWIRNAYRNIRKGLKRGTKDKPTVSAIEPERGLDPTAANRNEGRVDNAIDPGTVALGRDLETRPPDSAPSAQSDNGSISSSSDATTNGQEPETAVDADRTLLDRPTGRPALLAEEEAFSDSPRQSMHSQDTLGSSRPSEVDQGQGGQRSELANGGLRIAPHQASYVAENGAPTPIIRVRTPTFPFEPDGPVEPVEPGRRNLAFLQTEYLTPLPPGPPSPTPSTISKSPAPSVSEGDLMDEVMPHTIEVTVTITWEEGVDTWAPEVIPDFLWITPKSYDDLLPRKILDKHKEAHQDLENKEIYYRHGSCRVRSSPGFLVETPFKVLEEDHADSLSEAAFQIICKFISKHPRHPFSLEVYWDFGSAQLAPLPNSSKPFSEIIRVEMQKKKKRNFKHQEYIPLRDQNVFRRLAVVEEIIARDSTLDNPDNKLSNIGKTEFINTIVQKPASKLWMICVHQRLNMAFLRHLLLDHDYSDAAPPKINEDCAFPFCQEQSAEVLSFFPTFNVERVDGRYAHVDLQSNQIMPLHWTGVTSGADLGREELGKGQSSYVYKVRIDCSHHYLSGDPWCQFALKVFPDLRRKEFEREKDMLRVLADYPDPHVVLHLQSWSQDEQHYILYPMAAHNLRDFMQRYDRVNLSSSAVKWFLHQLLGLALAIKHVHNLKHPTNTDPNPNEDAMWGCHYDIKPENILVFEKHPGHYPSFKISDFGGGVFNKARGPGQDSVLTTEARGTETYFAPDLDRDEKVSRPFDMWALGCVYLELMVWLFGFFESGQGFSTTRFNCSGANPVNKNDGFWTKDANGNYILKSAVKDALHDLKTKNCVEMRAFLKVIKAIKRLLRPDPKQRWPAPKLAAYMTATLRQAKADLEKNPDFYMSQYAANCAEKPTLQRLPTERIRPDDCSGLSTRSPSPSSPERHRLSVDGRPRSETRSSQAVIQTGSGTHPPYGPGEGHDELQQVLHAMEISA